MRGSNLEKQFARVREWMDMGGRRREREKRDCDFGGNGRDFMVIAERKGGLFLASCH